jgi:hypothetical protein
LSGQGFALIAGGLFFFKRSRKVIVALNVQEIVDEHFAKKLV